MTSGMSGLVLLLSFIFVDFRKSALVEKLKWPFIWLGMNPLAIYVAMEIFEALLSANITFKLLYIILIQVITMNLPTSGVGSMILVWERSFPTLLYARCAMLLYTYVVGLF